MTLSSLVVLVVDDHRDTTDSLSLLLRLWGHEPVQACQGHAALELARAHRPDVIALSRAVLVGRGHSVETYANALAAFRVLREAPPDAVIAGSSEAVVSL